MNKRIIWISAVVVTAFALSLSAFAQPGGGQGRGPGGPGGPGGGMGGGGMMMGMGMGGGLGMFLRNPEVPKMLEMTPEQIESMQKIFEDARSQFRPQQGMPPNMEELRKRGDEIQAKAMQVLKPEQQTKFKQIHFQIMGGLDSPFLNDRMLEVLNLTQEQKDKLLQMQDERMAKMRENFQNFRDMSEEDREKMRTTMLEDMKKVREQVEGLLSAEQKAEAKKLSAGAAEVREKLGMPTQMFQGRGPGGRGPDGRGRGPGGGDEYRPGSNSWRPGQGTPDRGENAPPPGNRRFPRSEN